MIWNTEAWVQESERKYPGRFDYSETVYIDSYHKVKIKCKDHNILFEVQPSSFIRSSSKGHSCPVCYRNKNLTKEEFCLKAQTKHPFMDFSKSKFENIRNEIIVICSKHGEFLIQAKKVLYGQNLICPGCIKEDISGFDFVKFYTENPKGQEPGIFYKLKVIHKQTKIEFIKIGITSLTSYQRYDFSKYTDFEFDVIDEIHTTNLESAILERQFKQDNKSKRFFLPRDIDFCGRRELYEYDGYYQLLHSQVQFIRNSLLEKQSGLCPVCKRLVVMPTLDHYHSKKHFGSGLVRGTLCNTCNRIVGVIENHFFRNNIDYSDGLNVLRNIADYILESRTRYIHTSEKPKSPRLMNSSYNKLVKVIDGKQKVPPYTKRFSRKLELLFSKYKVEPTFY